MLTERERIEGMSRDPLYPTDFEWAAVFDRGALPEYERKTVENLRLIVAWHRTRLEPLERLAKAVGEFVRDHNPPKKECAHDEAVRAAYAALLDVIRTPNTASEGSDGQA